MRLAAENSCSTFRQFRQAEGQDRNRPTRRSDLDGTQPIAGLINACHIYKRGEGVRYEYRCDSSGFGTQPSQSAEKVKQIAASTKPALQAADPTLVWFDDPASRALADIEGFRGTEGWYGGYAKNKPMVARVEIVVSNATGNATIVTVFAKPVTRRGLK